LGLRRSTLSGNISIYDLHIGNDIRGNLLSLRNSADLLTLKLETKYRKASIYLLDSGRSALFLALKILKCEGHEVLVNAYTTDIVHKTIFAAGAKPRPYDINPETLEPDLDSIRNEWTDNVSAIVHTGLFGLPCNPSGIREESLRRNVPMIEDSCNSFGTLWHGEQCGLFGDLAIFSFRVGKPLSSGGGVLIINNPRIKKRSDFELTKVPAVSPVSSFFYFTRILLDYLAFNPFLLRFFTRRLRTYLRNSRLGRQIVRGGVVDTTSLPNPSKLRRMGIWQALIALANLEEYERRVTLRRDVAKKILKVCQNLPIKFLIEGLEDKWNGLFLPILLPSDCAEEYVEWMMRAGFEVTRFHYRVPELVFSRQIFERLPGTKLICKRLVCAPCTSQMNGRISKFYKAMKLFFMHGHL